MKAFHNDPKLKEKYIKRMVEHAAADEIIQGTEIEKVFGIPEILPGLIEAMFEGVPSDDAKKFATASIEAIPVGVDMSNVIGHVLIWLLVDEKYGVINGVSSEFPNTIKAIEDVAALWRRRIEGGTVTVAEFEAASGASAAATAGSFMMALGNAAGAAEATVAAGVATEAAKLLELLNT